MIHEIVQSLRRTCGYVQTHNSTLESMFVYMCDVQYMFHDKL